MVCVCENLRKKGKEDHVKKSLALLWDPIKKKRSFRQSPHRCRQGPHFTPSLTSEAEAKLMLPSRGQPDHWNPQTPLSDQRPRVSIHPVLSFCLSKNHFTATDSPATHRPPDLQCTCSSCDKPQGRHPPQKAPAAQPVTRGIRMTLDGSHHVQ